ncbi:Sugar phosphate isomerase/epimerase [Paenibacillus sp. OK060]|uniref:sugar phosphate isomerase/epimerase family protein n=1 Tax=Paenibacillus sp. OK060 TaxID=1881034 RepID=UPI0008800ADF|nr:sugar phosphate isomerase/epimerase [Paenibacillus sp. OK060]SDM33159.1 Sugar phosphate isomerase/epimerase [Paenibacillus sp. OK060]
MHLGLFTRIYQNETLEVALEKIKTLGINSVELTANNGSLHFDIERASDPSYKNKLNQIFSESGLTISGLAIHRDTQLVLGPYGEATQQFYSGSKEEQKAYGIRRTIQAAKAAKEYNIPLVIGHLGCLEFSQYHPWPSKDGWEKQKENAKSTWMPILEEYERLGIKFAHEISPQQMAYNLETALEMSELLNIDSFGYCLDPSNLLITGVDPSIYAEVLGKKIFNVHGKDTEFTNHLNTSGWMPHGDLNRKGRGFRSRIPGWGDTNWKKFLTAVKLSGYNGVISLEIDDISMSSEEAISKAKQFLEPILFE